MGSKQTPDMTERGGGTPETDALHRDVNPKARNVDYWIVKYQRAIILACRLEAERDNAIALLKRIADALGTGEEGDNLVAVARDSHHAEMELAAIRRSGE